MPASALMNVMVAAARKAGRSLARDFGEVQHLQVSIKGPANFVSNADLRAEEILYTELSKARSGYTFLMEERGAIAGSDNTHRWIVDPLDGTTNFIHAIPLFCTSIALEREGQLVAGVIYNPASDELYTAEKGKGAFMNDRRLRVAARRTLDDCLVATGIPHRGRPGHQVFVDEMAIVMRNVAGVRRTGSAALDLAWTAAGRFDAYWERGIQAWDMAAGILMVREAGGFATDLQGGDQMLDTGEVIVGNKEIQRALLSLVGSRPATSARASAGTSVVPPAAIGTPVVAAAAPPATRAKPPLSLPVAPAPVAPAPVALAPVARDAVAVEPAAPAPVALDPGPPISASGPPAAPVAVVPSDPSPADDTPADDPPADNTPPDHPTPDRAAE